MTRPLVVVVVVVLVELLCSLTPMSSVRFPALFLALSSPPAVRGSTVLETRRDPDVVRFGRDEVELCSLQPRSFLSFLPKLARLAISSSKSSVNFPRAASMADLFRSELRLVPLICFAANFLLVESSMRIDVSAMLLLGGIVISMDATNKVDPSCWDVDAI